MSKISGTAVAWMMAATCSLGTAYAQAPAATAPRASQPAAAPAPAPAPAKAPEPVGQPVNIRLDLTISDDPGSGAGVKKVVSMIVADRGSGAIRSRGRVVGADKVRQEVTINVDAHPVLAREGTVRLDLTLEYQPASAEHAERPVADAPASNTARDPVAVVPNDPGYSNLNQRISVILEPGKPLVISQASDPGSSRQISVEVKATVLR